MDLNDIGGANDPDVTELYARLLSLGYNQERAQATAVVYVLLRKQTAKLIKCKQDGTPLAGYICIGVTESGMFLHDDILLPSWEKFARALAESRLKCDILFTAIEIGQAVENLLIKSFEKAPPRTVALCNCPESASMHFVTNVVATNRSLEGLLFISNEITDKDAVESFVQAAADCRSPNFNFIVLRECNIGQNYPMMKAVVETFHHLRAVDLYGNGINWRGTKLIAACLQTNPFISRLQLDNNLLSDRDAARLAESLMSNTNLQELHLKGNKITDIGTYDLYNLVYRANKGIVGVSVGSNHTVQIFEDSWLQLERFNLTDDPKLNKQAKMRRFLYDVPGCPRCVTSFVCRWLAHTVRLPMVGSYHLHALCLLSYFPMAMRSQSTSNAPLYTLPRLIELLSGANLDNVYTFMRGWCMPLLYTSKSGPEFRRSERIREKSIKRHMELKNNLESVEVIVWDLLSKEQLDDVDARKKRRRMFKRLEWNASWGDGEKPLSPRSIFLRYGSGCFGSNTTHV